MQFLPPAENGANTKVVSLGFVFKCLDGSNSSGFSKYRGLLLGTIELNPTYHPNQHLLGFQTFLDVNSVNVMVLCRLSNYEPNCRCS